MPTDTVNKIVSIQTSVGKKLVTITGIAKGAGMIRPNMATMLAFIATDADVPDILQSCLNQAVEQSLNRITTDEIGGI
ncbi:bifunctional ornithine acetyltransferase/N-acetylglutamate synthase [Candidatus Halobeggiatoa sp. HSG11]|nr:bifunctional ornithine acetyltransferase/N-acetylglutamate synthase [Candidatus Halobeggiatoa sp. HSG11]